MEYSMMPVVLYVSGGTLMRCGRPPGVVRVGGSISREISLPFPVIIECACLVKLVSGNYNEYE